MVELSALGVEGMLEALEIVNQRTDKEALGAKVSFYALDRQWERC